MLAVCMLLCTTQVYALAQCSTFESFGNFSRMMQTGDTTANVKLSSLKATPGTWGVGALEGLTGEIIEVDGNLLVSPGSDTQGQTRPANTQDYATLWVSSHVTNWHKIVVPSDMVQAQFEAFIQQQAQNYLLDLAQPFAVRVTGDFANVTWHVTSREKAPRAQTLMPDKANHQPANKRVFTYQQASGQLVGIYSGKKLEGIVSHPGEPLHLHYINDLLTISGHVDHYDVKAKSVLWLPMLQEDAEIKPLKR